MPKGEFDFMKELEIYSTRMKDFVADIDDLVEWAHSTNERTPAQREQIIDVANYLRHFYENRIDECDGTVYIRKRRCPE